MSDPLGLTGEAAIVASQIRTIDKDLDNIEQTTRDSVITGLHSSGGALGSNLAQNSLDQKHQRLLDERAALVVRLKRLVAQTPPTAGV